MEPLTEFANTVANTPTSAPLGAPEMTSEEREEYDSIFDFNKAKSFLVELRDSFKPQVETAKANRIRRKIDIDIEAERAAKRIKQSDTLVPMRVIDEAIAREKPGMIAYLQQSRRLAVFVDKLNPDNKHDALEAAFTRGMQYQDWINSHYKVVDGAQLHGWDWYEVLYDETKTLHVGVESVGNDKLYFPLDCEDIQNCQRIMREFNWTKVQLMNNVKRFGFSPEEVKKVIQTQGQKSSGEGTTKDKTYRIFKVYQKFNNCVYISWMSFEGCSNWLKNVEKFYNGVDEQVMVEIPQEPIPRVIQGIIIVDQFDQPVMVPQPPLQVLQWQPKEETLYPVIPLFYEDTEQKEVSSKKGRAFKDKFKQEVMTVGWSSFLNGHNRATWLIPTKKAEDGKSNAAFESCEIADGKPIPFSVDWLKMPYPDPSMLQGLQAFDSKIATSAGQMTYAVQSKSSGARTTATEVQSAEKDTNLLSSVNITLFAGTVRKVYSSAWDIVQSQALQDKIQFYGTEVEIPAPMEGMEPIYEFQNDTQTISREYDIRPAGDVDVIQRQELLTKLKEYWEIVVGTPIAMQYLAYMLKIEFAEQGEQWAKVLMAGDPIVVLQQMTEVLIGIVQNPQDLMTLDPQSKNNLMTLIQMAQQLIAQRAITTQTNGQSNNSRTQSTGASSSGNNPAESGMANTTGNQASISQAPKTEGSIS